IMSMYDRDWYREAYKEQKRRTSSGRSGGSNKTGMEPFVFILLFIIVMGSITFVARMYTDFPSTIGLIAVNIIIFILLQTKKWDTSMLAKSYKMTIEGKQFYRIISSAFTQQEPLHLIMNMGSLYNLGEVLEPVLGMKTFLICYGVIMIVGGILSCFIHKAKSPFTRSIGASGVICGLLGIYIAIAFSYGGLAALRSVAPSLLIMALMTASKKIDSIGHFTGLAVGLVCGFFIVSGIGG
ncbi:MAG: rhomboid family intramembrane serine protease, partial [Lachnospiraceae bacterium]|nr:rhomboid family intramembrane serine protease [Lachnospiraceae bacterium]